MELYGNIKCVRYDELVPQILSKPNYDKHVRLRKIQIIQRGGNGHPALIAYDTLPKRIKESYDTLNPGATDELHKNLVSDMLIPDSAAVAFFRRHQVNESGLSDVVQAKCVLNAEVLNEMIRVEKSTAQFHRGRGHKHPEIVRKAMLDTCEALREKFGHTLPGSEQRLRRLLADYKKRGYVALISGKVGNQNTRKINKSEARLLLRLRRSKFPVYTEEQIWKKYNSIATEKGLNVLKSQSSVHNFFMNPAIMPLWFSSVYGELEFKQKYSAQFKTEMPLFRDSLWYGDGTKLNLYYQEGGKMMTTNVYEVMDAYSESFIGYDIAPGEKFDSQYRAFRMAVQTAGVRPYELVTDNQGGHKKLAAEGFFKRICRLHRYTMPHNGQSKTIESAFGRFQQQILHKIWYFTGQNITAVKKNSKVNIELVEANKDRLPTLDQLKKLYAECRAEWNREAHPTTGMARIDMYNESSNPMTPKVSETDMVQMFWLRSQKPLTYTNNGIRMELNKRTYEWEVYDAGGLRDERFAMKNTGRKFYIMYDPMDFTLVELWEPKANGMLLTAQATPRVSIHRATQDRTPAETSWMRLQLERNRQTRAAIQLAMADFDLDEQIAIELFGLVTPKPKGISKGKMAELEEKYDRGEIVPPVTIPGAEAKPGEEPETVGEHHKAISNLTTADLYDNWI